MTKDSIFGVKKGGKNPFLYQKVDFSPSLFCEYIQIIFYSPWSFHCSQTIDWQQQGERGGTNRMEETGRPLLEPATGERGGPNNTNRRLFYVTLLSVFQETSTSFLGFSPSSTEPYRSDTRPFVTLENDLSALFLIPAADKEHPASTALLLLRQISLNFTIQFLNFF